VVRRPAPVLTRRPRRRPGAGTLAIAAPLLALAYFLAAPALPALPAGDATTIVAGGAGLLMVAFSTLAIVPAAESLFGPLLIALGSGLLVGALNADGAHGVGAGANVAEALLAGAVGLLFARWLATPVIAIAVPIFVAAIDVWSVASGPTSQLLASNAGIVDPLSFDLPAWGGLGSAGHLGLSDALFLSMFAGWAWHYGFRRAGTIAGLALGLIAALVLGLQLHRGVPALPLLAAGYLLPNLDRIMTLLRHDEGPGATAPG
jgi:hypothetical protein